MSPKKRPSFLSPYPVDPVTLRVDELEWESLMERRKFSRNSSKLSSEFLQNYRIQERRALGLPDESTCGVKANVFSDEDPINYFFRRRENNTAPRIYQSMRKEFLENEIISVPKLKFLKGKEFFFHGLGPGIKNFISWPKCFMVQILFVFLYYWKTDVIIN